ncbi:MAG: hypothetical protein ABIP68_02760 [Ferruginibacter sp.]
MEHGKMYSLFNASGKIEELKPRPELPMYCKIYCFGAGMAEGEAAIIGTLDSTGQQKAVTLSEYEGNRFFYVDQYTRPLSKKFGIGNYYSDELECFTAEEVQPFIKKAEETELREAEEEKEAAIKAAQRKEYLSQFKTADRRTTTNILKRHILSTWKTVSKVEIKTDSFSGGDSMDVTYYAPKKIEELESFINSFQYGHFNSMEDIYEHSNDQEEIILEGHILQDYKYVFARFEEAEAPEETAPNFEKVEVKAGSVQIIDYSEKAIAVIGDTKPIKDKLKELGGRFNFRLSCGAGWIFPKTKLSELKNSLTNV